MIVPSWVIAVLALLYAGEYIYRAITRREGRYIYLGKAIGRLILSMTYWHIYFNAPTELEKQVLVRWSLFMFIFIDLFYVIQEHIMARVYAKH